MKAIVISLGLAVSACGTTETAPAKERSGLIPFKLEPGGAAFRGAVREVLPAGGYTYLRVDDAWVVSLKKQLAVGDVVRVKPFGVAEQFESKKLGRSFEVLQFSVVTKEQ